MMISGKWMAAPLLAVASLLMTADAPSASAQGGFLRVGGLSISVGQGGYRSFYSHAPSYHSHYGHSRVDYGHSRHVGHRAHLGGRSPIRHGSRFGHGWYHDTSHYDYHPSQVVPHGNHYDVIPGHYDFHRTGHWHHR